MRPTVRRALTFVSTASALSLIAVAAQAKLQLGDRGEEVKVLQELLTEKSTYKGAIDGKFGASTIKAVQTFQDDAAMKSDGVVGKATWGKLIKTEKTLRLHSKGIEVRWLQALIKQDGVATKIDGDFGAATVAAVKKIQKTYGLKPVDGVAGKKTWRMLKD